jgi:NADH-quinone oxidoreductase subunit L
VLELLWVIPAVPLASALVLLLVGSGLPRHAVAMLGCGSVAVSAVLSLLIWGSFAGSPPAGHAFQQTLWTWMDVGGLRPAIGFYLDALSLVMILVVTCVGFLIHVYSSEFMIEDDAYSRFFAYMNLFVASMLVLLLGDNLVLLYLGWEGVGLCSYLLIGFWYQDPANGLAARKAFLVTRVGDVAMAIGLFVLFTQLGTLDIQELMHRAAEQWPAGSGYAVAAAALLLGGAVGKSAQLPLQTWLPDAMAGPTPTSALIHAATMVTAGVYLIARTNVLFALAPDVQLAVAVVGAVTLLVAGLSALTQYDIKRVLAYSTVSQIGYMFLALGVGAWSAAMFHFMTHAFFKALLFLAAGVVIHALHHEHNMFKMGGLRKELPVAFGAFAIGGSALAGLPLITAGFYSKDLILWLAWSSDKGSPWLWGAGMLGALLTAAYTYRLIFLVFFGEAKTHVGHRPGLRMTLPLVVLSFLSVVAGFINLPPGLGDMPVFSKFIETAVPAAAESHHGAVTEHTSMLVAMMAFAVGLFTAYWFFLRRPQAAESLAAGAIGGTLHRFWLSGWGFDSLYDRLFVRPLLWTAKVNKDDFVDAIYTALALTMEVFHRALSLTETGRVRWYAAGIVAGSIAFVALALFL